MTTENLAFTPVDNQQLANLCGPLDANLRQFETAFDISIARRAEQFRLEGHTAQVRRAASALTHFYQQATRALDLEDIQLGLLAFMQTHAEASHGDVPTLLTKRPDLRGRTPRQSDYLRAIRDHDITFGVGPAGTGKTYLAVACAVDALERDNVKRVVLTRPAVEAGEKLGFLPGDLAQKVDPYLRPLFDALYDLYGFDKTMRAMERGAIEIAPLAFMRGRTLNHAFIILDEAQNTTPEQMKMFLTRIGFGSKAVVTGDVTQVDLPRHQKSGLNEAIQILNAVRGIGFQHFTSSDVVRHPLVQRIVEAYAAAETTATTHGRNHPATAPQT